MKKIFLILIISINWAIGIQALNLPSTAQSLALSNTGIALPLNSFINSSYNLDGKSEVSFSTNYWFEGVNGKTISNKFGRHEISLNNFNIDDLDLWGESPDSEPLGQFRLQFSCLSYQYLINKSVKQNLGVKLKGVYSKLYTEHIYGLLFDVGLEQNINQYFNVGLTIKNIGHIKSDLAISNLPTEYGLGFSYSYKPLGLVLLTDFIYNDIEKEIFKFGCITNFKFFNIYTSLAEFKTNRYVSTGFEIKYKNLSFSYGILFQKIKILGLPQSFQVTLYY